MELAIETIRVLRRFRNAVLEGPPGTGKTHVVWDIAQQWQTETQRPLMGTGRGKYAITLHPNTTYEEFVEGLRYDDNARSFTRQDGFLLRIIDEARANPDSDFLVLIDELNRANVPKVFGDLLLCMESSKRQTYDGTEWRGGMEVTLPYSGTPFAVPNNLFLLGTMNSSDRSIAPLDSALRRRFGFIHVEPMVGAELRQAIEAANGPGAVARVARSIDEITNLNEAIRRCLGPNAMIGHSYLFDVDATEGTLSAPQDPLADIRQAVALPNVAGAFWLEARVLDGGSHNQLNLPDADQTRRRANGAIDWFFPMASAGKRVGQRSPKGVHDHVDITFEGHTYIGNVVRFNSGGPNFKLYYQGKTSSGEKFSKIGSEHRLEQCVHVWLRQQDDTFELRLLNRTDTVLAALRAASTWIESSGATSGREYGSLDLAKLAGSTISNSASSDEDAEWMIWRYAILPQLIDGVTQVGATDLLNPDTRQAWLEAAGHSGVHDRWTKFDDFLATLSLAIREEGYGLTRGLMIVDIPVGAISEYLTAEEEIEDDVSESTQDNN